ncbi:hypothetical protein ACOMHN_055061 [Nucella lapillus]
MNVHDVLNQLEEDGFFTANVYITPPGDGQLSDEDSADEDGGGQVNNLSRRQLQAEAEGVVIRSDGQLVRMGGPNYDNVFDRDPTARPASPQQAPAPPQQAPASPQQAPASPQQAPAPRLRNCQRNQQAPASPQQAPAPRLRNRQRNQPAPNQVAVPRQQLAGRMLQNQRQQRLQQPAVRNWRREDLPRNLNLQQQWPVLPQA